MKKIVIVTAVLTTTLVYDASATESSKPEYRNTVIDIVAVGRKNNAGAWGVSKKPAKASAQVVKSDMRTNPKSKKKIVARAAKTQRSGTKKNVLMAAAEKRAAELAAANRSWFKPKARDA
jgi:hypothetical protein